jgi:hypothetical protein
MKWITVAALVAYMVFLAAVGFVQWLRHDR